MSRRVPVSLCAYVSVHVSEYVCTFERAYLSECLCVCVCVRVCACVRARQHRRDALDTGCGLRQGVCVCVCLS